MGSIPITSSVALRPPVGLPETRPIRPRTPVPVPVPPLVVTTDQE